MDIERLTAKHKELSGRKRVLGFLRHMNCGIRSDFAINHIQPRKLRFCCPILKIWLGIACIGP
jgi:hypothetical protein